MRVRIGHGWPVALLLVCSSAAGNLVVNGSFEDPPGQHYIPVQQTFNGWRVVGDGGIKIGDFWQAAQGSQEIDLCGIAGGAIQQMIATTSGQRYVLSFALAGNPDGDPAIKPMVYTIGDADPQTVSFNITGHSATNMGWTYYHVPFIATSDSTVLLFSSAINANAGPALDDVSVDAVPPGDANEDLRVGFDDLLVLAQHYGSTGASWNDGDFDGDGVVGFSDLLALAQHYGENAANPGSAVKAATVTVPEPRMIWPLAPAAALCLRKLRR
jgi:choice-of-anchor C domain-containing protein